VKATYLPAILPGTLADRWDRRPINWTDPRTRKSGCFYPHALLSAHHWRGRSPDLPAKGLVFGDSGGFQILSLGARPDPRSVLSWQLKEVDEGPILDVPPVEAEGAPKDPDLRFRLALRRTVQHLEAVLSFYRRAKRCGIAFRWLGVAHGRTRGELEWWWREISAVHPFEGWAVRPAPPNSPVAVARILAFARDHEIERLHTFIPGGPACVAVLLALGPEAGVRELTWDNSSPMTLANNRGVYVADRDGLGWKTLEERFRATNGRDRRVRDWMLRKCGCLSCGWFREDVVELAGSGLEELTKFRMAFHNVIVTLRVYENLQQEAERDPMGLLRKLLGRQLRPVIEEFERRNTHAT